MKEMTKDIVDYLLEKNQIEQIVEQRYESLIITFQRLFHNIPKIIEADECLITELSKTLEHAEENRMKCGDLLKLGEGILGHLDVLYITKLTDQSTDVDQFQNWSYINEGVYARVYKARDTKDRPVALKVLKNPITYENSTEFLEEEFNLK